jgi:hypothetical protein
MSTFIKNNRGLLLLVVILFLSNIGLLAYFLFWKKPEAAGPQRGNFSVVDHMKKEIGFNDEQTTQFRQMLEQNRDSMKKYSEQVKLAKTALYKLLQNPAASDSAILIAGNKLAQQQEAMELVMFRHFQRVRKLCVDSQVVKFDTMITRMSNRAPWSRRGNQPKPETEKKD